MDIFSTTNMQTETGIKTSLSVNIPSFSCFTEDDSCGSLVSVGSPMTELALDLKFSSVSTPRRKLSLDSPAPQRKQSVDSGVGPGSPALGSPALGSPALMECPDFDSPTIENIKCRKKVSSGSDALNLRRRIMMRSHSSPVTRRKPLEPLNFNFAQSPFQPLASSEENNVDSEVEKHSNASLLEMDDDFPMETIATRNFRRKGGFRSNSAPTYMEASSMDESDSQVSFPTEDFEDDGFFEAIDKGSSSPSNSVPSGFMGLMHAPLIMPENDKENVCHSRTLSRSLEDAQFAKPTGIPLGRNRSNSYSVKREKPDTDMSPISRKRSRTSLSQEIPPQRKPRPFLGRSQSFDTRTTKSPGIDITSLLDVDDKTLIGDRSREYCLPLTDSKHPDLKGITPSTLIALMENEYKDVVDEFFIIDCRYPYEYRGGHIKGAVNLYEKDSVIDHFMKSPTKAKPEKRQILIFHCEFSSKRGPNMCRFLRNKDRDNHQHCYPKLDYPEMYILEGGYKEFFAKYKEYCDPQAYLEMIDDKYSSDLKHFNRKSKSWSDTGCRRTGLRY